MQDEEFAVLSRRLGQVNALAHQLRNSLQSMLGFAQLLAGEHSGSLNEKQREYVKMVEMGGMQALKLIEELEIGRHE